MSLSGKGPLVADYIFGESSKSPSSHGTYYIEHLRRVLAVMNFAFVQAISQTIILKATLAFDRKIDWTSTSASADLFSSFTNYIYSELIFRR